MTIDIVTIFPRMADDGLAEGVFSRGMAEGLLDIKVQDLRGFTADRHRSVDDVPYGGGPGMVMKPEPLVKACEAIRRDRGTPDAVVVLSPQGRRFDQRQAVRLAGLGHNHQHTPPNKAKNHPHPNHHPPHKLSIGDYVLSGGELAALVVVDAVGRLIPGVVGDGQSVEEDSFSRGLLDYPHYTRPAVFAGRDVPPVLLSGHHAEVRRWRRKQALARTLERRPDLLAAALLDDEDRALLAELRQGGPSGPPDERRGGPSGPPDERRGEPSGPPDEEETEQ
jgi:tRNA (guanine37-N1)-methyltransferase